MKAVLDSSVLISAFLTPHGASARVVRAGTVQDRVRLVLSPLILEETARSLLRKATIRTRYRFTDGEVHDYSRSLAATALLVSDLPVIPPTCLDDPEDDHVLAAGLAAAADYVVSGDRHLLTLERFEGIRIVAVTAFLEALQGR